MTEYAIRFRSLRGPIVNFVATDSRASAEKVLERMEGGPYVLDPNPTVADLKAYEMAQIEEYLADDD